MLYEVITIVLGETKPLNAPGIYNYPESDKEISNIADKLWTQTSGQIQVRKMGKGKVSYNFV